MGFLRTPIFQKICKSLLLLQDLGHKSFLKSIYKWTADFIKNFLRPFRLSVYIRSSKKIIFTNANSGQNKLSHWKTQQQKKLTPIYISQLYKLHKSENGTKISDEKWHSAKTKYLENKEW